MRADILALLRESETYVSGEEIGGKLGISRTAVWKWLAKLAEEGYEIESKSRSGYRLLSSPDKAYPWEVQPRLRTAWLGRSYAYLAETGSTNRDLREKAEAGAENGTLVAAEIQRAGKGRRGRRWLSQSGGLWFSYLLRPRLLPAQAPLLTLVTAVGLARGLESYGGLSFGIKWPNDILWQGKKVAGILAEMKAEWDNIDYVVIGIGLNCRSAAIDGEIAALAVSLEEVWGEAPIRNRLLPHLLLSLEEAYEQFFQAGFGPLRQEWEKRSLVLGRPVRILDGDGGFAGTALALLDDGGLLVETAEGRRVTVHSGDVSLRLREEER